MTGSVTVNNQTLGSNTKSASANRALKYKRQRIAGDLLPDWRVSWCSRRLTAQTCEIRTHEGRAYYHNIAVCGDAKVCPICASRISNKRGDELRSAVQAWNGTLIFATITLQHSREDDLSVLLDALTDAWRETKAGRAYQRTIQQYKIKASVTSTEITYSQEAGYHPHKHILMFSELAEDELDVEALEAELTGRWRSNLAKRGRYGSEYYSLKVQKGTKPVAGYLAKWGSAEEIAYSNLKKGRNEHLSMWQVLDVAGEGEAWAIKAFKNYAHAMKGRRMLVWSKGARELLGLGEEVTDEDIAQEEQTQERGELVCTLTRCEWYSVCKREERARVLELAEQEGALGVKNYLQALEQEGNGTIQPSE